MAIRAGRIVKQRPEWQFFTVLPRADRRLAALWWAVLVARGILPAGFAIATGILVAAVQAHASLAGPLTLAGVVFVALQVLSPIHTAISNNLGDRTSAWLNDRLAATCVAPPGLGHLEDHELTADLTVARDFDLGQTGPPLSIALDFIAGGLVELIGGLASAVLLAGSMFGRRSATPTTRTVSPSIRPRPRSCACSGSPAGSSSGSPRAGRRCTSCSTGRPGCASAR